MCNGCNGVSLGDHGVPEGNRIPSLKSHGKALEQESGFPGVFCDCSDASADLLCQLCCHLMPHTSCFHGKGVEDMRLAQFSILVCRLLCRCMGCCTWGNGCVGNVGLCIMCLVQSHPRP